MAEDILLISHAWYHKHAGMDSWGFCHSDRMHSYFIAKNSLTFGVGLNVMRVRDIVDTSLGRYVYYTNSVVFPDGSEGGLKAKKVGHKAIRGFKVRVGVGGYRMATEDSVGAFKALGALGFNEVKGFASDRENVKTMILEMVRIRDSISALPGVTEPDIRFRGKNNLRTGARAMSARTDQGALDDPDGLSEQIMTFVEAWGAGIPSTIITSNNMFFNSNNTWNNNSTGTVLLNTTSNTNTTTIKTLQNKLRKLRRAKI